MKILYDGIMWLLRVGVGIASFFNTKARSFVEGRRSVFNKLEEYFKDNGNGKVIWIHCASLGEFEQGRPVIEGLKNEFPDCKVVLTFFSPSGFEVRKQYPLADVVCYLPWDTNANAVRFVALVKPVLAIFVKYEFWYHYLSVLNANRVAILSISSIFRTSQLFFKPYGGFYRDMLKRVTYFFVQNSSSLSLLKSIDVQQCMLAGDTRFDRVYQIVSHAEEVPIARRFKNATETFVVGSCWPEDLEVLKPFILEQDLKFIIAPHEISNAFIERIQQELKVPSIRYSMAQDKDLMEFKVLIIDNMGMLSRLYRYGEFAYVGGAFGKGLHNILEAACYGMPVFFGNKVYHKFQEAVDLISAGGAFAISDAASLGSQYRQLKDPDAYVAACSTTRDYVKVNLGATEKILTYCRQLLSR
ncbi:MAG TPA: glycosyltransferase N-terminal domain-containing protein [Chryseolinea sp.]|nr:glycosyltransferase N-terminal domain-containing protein [Chryseolinea sp.]